MAAAIVAMLMLLAACSPTEGSGGAPSGSLEIVLETDLSLPKDFNHVTLRVTQKSQLLLLVDKDVGPDALRLPATFEVKSTSDPSPVTIQAVGYKDHKPIVERDAVTPIPTDQSGILNLALDYLCVGTAQADPDGGVSSTCSDGLTCILGQCKTATVPPSALAPVSSDADASIDAGPSGCFDVVSCFASAATAAVDLSTCAVTLPAGTDAATVNIGLQFPLGGTGICGPNFCWVSLTGWTVTGSKVQLPPAACKDAASQGAMIVVSTACNAETANMPPCGGWSSVTTPATQPPTKTSGPIGTSCDASMGSQKCGFCGTQMRTCNGGVYGPWSACTGVGPCAPGAVQSCGTGGTQTCGNDCQWSACGCDAGQLACGAPGTCVSATDAHTCGSCDKDCTVLPNIASGPSCSSGQCTYSCAAGFADCGNAGAGCATDLSSATSCGACGDDCTSLPHVMGATTCQAGKCAFPTSACAPGYGDCNGDPTDGCETALNVAGHCGACSTTCSGTTSVCDSSAGTPRCVATCTGTVCSSACVDVTTSPTHCGSCTNSCPIPAHGQPACAASKCGATCNTGYTSCSGVCADTTSDVSHCGTCGHACPSGSSCQSSKCTCTGATTRSCGNCGTQTATCNDGTLSWGACSAGGTCAPGATQSCDTNGSQSCGTACSWNACICNSGYTLCNGTCVDYQLDARNCGSCANVCGLANATASCSAGSCAVATCTTGFGNCDGNAANGCEANLNTDPSHCGKCAACSLANATASCSAGACAVSSCATGFGNCDSSAANGCEANLNTDSNNCGACGAKCGAGSSCQGGTCKCSGSCTPSMVEAAYLPVGLASDGKFLYWTDGNTNNSYTYPSQYVTSPPQYPGVVMMAPITGGTPFMLSWNWPAPEGIATDGTNVFWTDAQSGQIMKTAVVPTMDYNKLVIPTTLYTDSAPHAIAVNGTNVFWNTESGTVKTLPSSLTSTATTATQVNSGSFPYGGSTPGGLAVDATNVYYADNDRVWQVPANSNQGMGVALFTASVNLTNPFGIAVDAHNVYWTNYNTGTATDSVLQVPISGSTVVTVAPAQKDAIDIVSDGTNVYWTAGTGGQQAVMKAPIGGPTPITLATVPAGQQFTFENVPLGLVVDSTSVYWVTTSTASSPAAGSGAIMKIAK